MWSEHASLRKTQPPINKIQVIEDCSNRGIDTLGRTKMREDGGHPKVQSVKCWVRACRGDDGWVNGKI